jgi:hypothetical protein
MGMVVYSPALVINGNEINFNNTTFHAGNVITVSAKVTTRDTTVQITDLTTRVTKRRTGPGARPSAAYIGDNGVLAPRIRLGVPSFGTIAFTSCFVDGRALGRSHPLRFQRVNSRGVVQIAIGPAISEGNCVPRALQSLLNACPLSCRDRAVQPARCQHAHAAGPAQGHHTRVRSGPGRPVRRSGSPAVTADAVAGVFRVPVGVP